jgi:hypothetical protein
MIDEFNRINSIECITYNGILKALFSMVQAVKYDRRFVISSYFGAILYNVLNNNISFF